MTNQATIIKGCVFCEEDGGEIVWSNEFARVINVNDPDHPAYCRVVLKRHVREMTDLAEAQRSELMRIVFAAEEAQRALLAPEKTNLASFGNMVAHMHWHVIPRFSADPHYPNPVWGAKTNGSVQALPENYWPRFRAELIKKLDLGDAL